MNNAVELLAMKEEAITARNALINAEYEKATINSINLCETIINDEFVKRAKAGRPLRTFYWMGLYSDNLGHKIFRFGINGPGDCKSATGVYALKPFIDYLLTAGFKIKIGELESLDNGRMLTILIPEENKKKKKICAV